MAEAIFDAMGEVLTRWSMGSAAAPAAAMWNDALGAEPEEAELRLLALASHFLGVTVTAAPPPDLLTLSDVPKLALPTVPDALRPLVRRLLATDIKSELLRFIDMRGWTVHPGDWMPHAQDRSVPDVYAPWRDWAAASSGPPKGYTDDWTITLENWDSFYPASRKVALAQLRQQDPAAVRQMFEAKFAQENAETRLGLLEVLRSGLSDSDSEFLESIAASDRAPKVKALAASLLARLGRLSAHREAIAELKTFFSVQVKGFLRRTRTIGFENVKTPAQQQRRAALFESVDFAAFAAALGLAAEELVSAWPWDTDYHADAALVDLVERTGTNAIVMQTAMAVGAIEKLNLSWRQRLTRYLTAAQTRELAAAALHTHGRDFSATRSIVSGGARLTNPLATKAGLALLAALARSDAKPTDQSQELYDLGLITDRAWARRVIDRLNAAGIVQGDPRLDMLRLNEALEDRGDKP